ncbi:pyridoxal phosphate-dependent aminotransferase [Aurantimonas sp. VKM B-3413]|uniref:pyridoxal phosphate-dependent aminotransferase n=1 Tax=Aurantimonas sp. VKM B-3413 TaxID=2779401 RepID=UPI001E6432B4|nr:pyridoxal phosphate-dependent aminotransferase [Aurantimonas sp. VKM B-3413]MCB8839295.1 pyridoxal phosphate-dependent aminotransferase [Aurantimonas sp. VKM B-3413]
MTDITRLRREAVAAPESGIVAVINHARAGGLDGLIPLWAGEGDLATPDFISEAAAESLRSGETFYTWQRGVPELRQALADYTARLYGGPADPNRFFVTGSGMQAIQISLIALAGAGDEVVYLGPAWPNFAAAAGLIGANPREVALDWTEAGWHLDLDRLQAAIGPKTRAIFVNTPGNPTGWTADRETLAAILAIARKAGVGIIADEIYNRFYYAGGRAASFHDVMEEGDLIFFVNSFSKNWAMTGWRVGWIETDPAFGQVIENLIQYSTSGVAAFMQRGAIAAIEKGEDFVESQIARAHQARDIFAKRLIATNRVQMTPPDGAFYAFFAIDGLADTREAAFRIVDEARVGLAPGTAFGPAGPRFMRACFHRRLDEVEMAADRLADWIAKAV